MCDHESQMGEREGAGVGGWERPQTVRPAEVWAYLVLPRKGDPSLHPFHRRAESLREEMMKTEVSTPRPSPEATASFSETYTALVKSKSFPTLVVLHLAPSGGIRGPGGAWGGTWGTESRCGPTATPG